MDNKLDCEDCKQFFFLKDKLDYDCVFQISQETGIEEKKLRYHTRPSLRKRYKNGLAVIKIEEVKE